MTWAQFAPAEEKDYSDEPWEKAALYLGAFVIDTNSDLELGIGKSAASVKVDAEEVLGLEKNFTVLRADGFWRITRRNRVDFKIESKTPGGINLEETDFTVPLPVIGLRANFALTPKWFIRQSIDYFYVNIGGYEGQLIDLNVALERNALKYLGFEVGYYFVAMGLDYSGNDNFLSEIDLSYGGLLLFGKLYF